MRVQGMLLLPAALLLVPVLGPTALATAQGQPAAAGSIQGREAWQQVGTGTATFAADGITTGVSKSNAGQCRPREPTT